MTLLLQKDTMNIADQMLFNAEEKRRKLVVIPPALRRQIAGSLDNPYDLDHFDNRDIKLFCEVFFQKHQSHPPPNYIETIALFPAADNLETLYWFSKI